MPQLTETWGGAYFQALIMLFVFALGIPTLIFQLAVPGEIRRIIYRRTRMGLWYCLTLFIGLATLYFVWFLHPILEDKLTNLGNYAAAIEISLILIIIIIYWLVKFRSCSRERVVRKLQRLIIKYYSKEYIIDDTMLDDLISIGEAGNAGDEKQMVIESLECVAIDIQKYDHYSGNLFHKLLDGFVLILGNRNNIGNKSNYLNASRTLNKIFRTLQNNNDLISSSDAKYLLKASTELGRKAIELDFGEIPLMYLQILEKDNISLFKFGLSAISCKKYKIVIAVLSKLKTIILINLHDNEKIQSQQLVYLLGLCAYLWKRGGTAQRYVEEIISSIEDSFAKSLSENLTIASGFYKDLADFITADMLNKMLAEVS